MSSVAERIAFFSKINCGQPQIQPTKKTVRFAEQKPLPTQVGPAFKKILQSSVQVQAKPQVKPQAKPQVKPQVKSQVKPQVKLSVKPQVKLSVKPQAKPQANLQVKLSVKPQAKPPVKPPVKPQTKVKPQANLQVKPQVKLSVKPLVSCIFLAQGGCKNADKCNYNHTLCVSWSTCTRKDCPDVHPVFQKPSQSVSTKPKITNQQVCAYFSAGKCTFGAKCKNIHLK